MKENLIKPDTRRRKNEKAGAPLLLGTDLSLRHLQDIAVARVSMENGPRVCYCDKTDIKDKTFGSDRYDGFTFFSNGINRSLREYLLKARAFHRAEQEHKYASASVLILASTCVAPCGKVSPASLFPNGGLLRDLG